MSTGAVLVVLAGTSFSGRSTLARALAERLPAEVVSLGAISAERGLDGGQGIPTEEWAETNRLARERAQERLVAAETVIVDGTGSPEGFRDDWRSLAEGAGAALVFGTAEQGGSMIVLHQAPDDGAAVRTAMVQVERSTAAPDTDSSRSDAASHVAALLHDILRIGVDAPGEPMYPDGLRLTAADALRIGGRAASELLTPEELASVQARVIDGSTYPLPADAHVLRPDARFGQDALLETTVLGERTGTWLLPGEPEAELFERIRSQLQDFVAESSFGWGQLRP